MKPRMRLLIEVAVATLVWIGSFCWSAISREGSFIILSVFLAIARRMLRLKHFLVTRKQLLPRRAFPFDNYN